MIRTSARNEVMVVLSVFRDDREALSGLLKSRDRAANMEGSCREREEGNPGHRRG